MDKINAYEDIDELGLDIMKEIGSIGTGNAATALSNILHAEVKMSLPTIKVLTFADASYMMGHPESGVIAVHSEMSQEMEGTMLFIFKEAFAKVIAEKMLFQELSENWGENEFYKSAMTEIGNIVISSYVSVLSEFAGLNIMLSVPTCSINMVGGVLAVPMADVGYETDKLMMITGDFYVDNELYDCHLLMVPSIESLDKLLKKMGSAL